MNFLKRYRCRSVRRPLSNKGDEDTSFVSELGFDGAECVYYQSPTAEELDLELSVLGNLKLSKSRLVESLNKIQTWTMVVTSDAQQDAAGRIFVKHQVVPAMLTILRRNVNKAEDDTVLVEKAAQILKQCTSFHDRRTAKQEKYSKDMIMQLVKHNGVKSLVKSLDYHFREGFQKKQRPLFKRLWTTLLNVATCDKAVSLLKLPKTNFAEQECLLLDAIPTFLKRAEIVVPAFWMERLFISFHLFLKFNGVPDAQTRHLLARNSILDELLDTMVHGRRKLVVSDPCVTALAMSFFLVCLRDGTTNNGNKVQYDALHNSFDMDRLTRFTVRAMKAFPSSEIIQSSGGMILNEIPPVYRVLACHDTAMIVPSNCGADSGNVGSGTTANNTFSSVVGPCWMCRPSQS